MITRLLGAILPTLSFLALIGCIVLAVMPDWLRRATRRRPERPGRAKDST